MKSIFINNKLINLNYVARVDRYHSPAEVGTEGKEKGKEFPENNRLTIIFGSDSPSLQYNLQFSFDTKAEMDEVLENIKGGMDCIDL